MNNIWLIIQSIISVLIVAAILMQSQGGGLGSAWGGGGGGETYHTKRGVEKIIYNLTIVLIVIFALVSIATLITK